MAHDTLGRADLIALRGASRVHGKYVSIAHSPLEASKSKFACVVSKQVSPKAVIRNAVKRKIRDAVRPLLQKTPHLAIVCTAKREAAAAGLAALKADIEAVFARLPGRGTISR
jgi:ribonuclease P protein component